MSKAPEILLYIVDAGGGHRSAANALIAAAEQTRFPYAFRVVSLQGVLDSMDFTRFVTGRSMEETYNQLLRKGGTRLMVPMLRGLHLAIALAGRRLRRLLADQLAQSRPPAVVSLAPNFNRLLSDAVHETHPGAPFLVLLTDYADFPPRFWIEPGVDRVIVGSPRAVDQALALGLPSQRVSLTTGMPLHPRFYPPSGDTERAMLRQKLGIGPDQFTVLLLFGGMGAREMEPLAERLLAQESFHVIALTGRNPCLLERMQGRVPGAGGRLHVEGFTDRVPAFLAASDVLVTKPGPGSLAEAFHQRIPVVVVRDARTVPQERFNTEWIERHGLGVVVRQAEAIPDAVADLARDVGRREAICRAQVSLPENRAVYEALSIIGREAESSSRERAR